MFELKKNEEINRLIAITKSDSEVCGSALAEAHMELGRFLGEQIGQLGQFEPEETMIVAVLRGGYFSRRGCILQWDAGLGFMIRSMRKSCGRGRSM